MIRNVMKILEKHEKFLRSIFNFIFSSNCHKVIPYKVCKIQKANKFILCMF
jgi:hypothetical protein